MSIRENCPINLNIIKGEDRIHEFEFLRIVDDSTNPTTTVPVDLTGSTITFTIKDFIWDYDSEAILQLDSDGTRVVLTDPTNGKFTVKVEKEDLANLSAELYKYDIQITLAIDSGGYSAGSIITPFLGAYELLDHAHDKLIFTREDTNFFNLQAQIVTNAESTPIVPKNLNLTSATYQFLAQELVDDDTNLIGAPTVSPIDPVNGQVKIIFDPEDTEDIEYLGTKKRELHFWLKITLGTSTGNSPYVSGDLIIPMSGILTILMDRTLT